MHMKCLYAYRKIFENGGVPNFKIFSEEKSVNKKEGGRYRMDIIHLFSLHQHTVGNNKSFVADPQVV